MNKFKISRFSEWLFFLAFVIILSPSISKNELKSFSQTNKLSKFDRIDKAIEQEFEMTRDPKLGLIPSHRLFKAKRDLQQGKYSKSGFPGLEWQERGPTNVGGRTRAILIDQSDVTGNTIFAGSVSGGLWKCTNCLSDNPEWQTVDDFFESLAIGAIAQDPNDSNIIYFGTGEGYFNNDAVKGMGIWKTTNGGSTWSFLSSTENDLFDFVQSIVINDDGDIFAATRNGGIQRSTDGGNSWSMVLGEGSGADVDRASDLEIDNDGILYAGMGIFETDGIYKSSDNGNSWTKITTGLPSSDYYRIELDIAPSNNDVLYAAFHDKNNHACLGIFKTTNAGSSWTEMDNPEAVGMNNFARNQAWYNLSLEVDPEDANRVILGGIDLHLSENGGTSWNQISSWQGANGIEALHADQHALLFNPNNTSQLFIGNDGGVFVSENAQSIEPTFTSLNQGYNVLQLYSADLHPDAYEDYFLGGSQDNGTQQYSSEGLNETVMVSGGDGSFCHIDQLDPRFQFTSYVYNNYWVSINGGNSFTQRYFLNEGRFINPTDYDDTAKKLYAAHANGQYFRWNNPASAGANYSIVNVAEFNTSKVSAVKVSPNVDNRIYFGLGNGDLVMVDNANIGTNKTGVLLREGLGYMSSIEIEEGNEDHILVTYSNYGVTSIFETFDGGDNWHSVEGNLPDFPVRWILLNPNNSDQALIATEMGVWSTQNLNQTSTQWESTNDGLAHVRVDMLKLRSSDNLVVAATHGRGLFSSNHFTPLEFSFKKSSNTIREFSAINEAGDCVSNANIVELEISLNKAPLNTTTINISADDLSTMEETDYILSHNSVSFTSNGPLTKLISVNVLDDGLEEADENLILILSSNAAEEGEIVNHEITVIDNDYNPVSAPDELDYFVGTDILNQSNAPFKGYYEDEKTHILIKAEELSDAGISAGALSRIAFDVSEKNSSLAFLNFNLKLKHTTLDELQANSNFSTGFTQVFNENYTTTLGWNTIEFNNEFVWNGVDNLLLELCYNNISWSNDDAVKATSTSFNSVLYTFDDGVVGCNLVEGTHVSNVRPNIRFSQQLNLEPSNTLDFKSTEINAGELVHFYDSNENIIMSIRNLETNNLGCITVEVDEWGAGRISESWLNGEFRTEKTFYVLADTDINYEISLYFNQNELAQWSNPATLNMIKSDGRISDENGNSFEIVEFENLDVSNFGDDNHLIYKAEFTGFSGFALTEYSEISVPLELLSFNGEKLENDNLISWRTTAEFDLDGFILEYSENGFDYSNLYQESATNSYDAINSYSYLHKDLIPGDSYYYRLKSLNNDGSYEYSQIIFIERDDEPGNVNLFPNPASDLINFKSDSSNEIRSIKVFDALGRTMKVEISESSNNIQLNIADMPSGNYNVLVSWSDGNNSVHKFIKQ